MTYNISEDGTNKGPLDQETNTTKCTLNITRNIYSGIRKTDSSDYKRTVRIE